MRVEFGNDKPTATMAGGVPFDAPTVTYCGPLDDNEYQAHDDAATLAANLAQHIATAGTLRAGDVSDGTGNHEAFLTTVAGWRAESSGNPTWVWSDNHDFAVLLSKFFGCPIGAPDDVEMTHYTRAGAPGVGPAEAPDDPTSATDGVQA